MVMKKRGELHPFPGQVLDFDSLPEGTTLQRDQQVRFRGHLWRIDTLVHCFDDALVLRREDGQARWCDLCQKEVGLEESDSMGPLL